MDKSGNNWTSVIKPRTGWWDLQLNKVWRYRDLLFLFVRRDFVAYYKQTILGPLWFFIQPLLTTLVFTVIFGKVAKIPTDGIPHIPFYLAGVTAWNYFAECIGKTSTTFTTNARIFEKVYFPRIIVPLSVVVSNLMKFGVQFLLFAGVLVYYLIIGENSVQPNSALLLFPVLILIMAGLGLGIGMIISSLTTKYRDLKFLVSFGVRLLMYATPVVYPLSFMDEKYKWIIEANPMTAVIETFKYGFIGAGSFEPSSLVYSFGFMLVVLMLGVIIFNKTEKSFVDTV